MASPYGTFCLKKRLEEDRFLTRADQTRLPLPSSQEKPHNQRVSGALNALKGLAALNAYCRHL
jgi:hypothetical protein